jgi:hypothetical protein
MIIDHAVPINRTDLGEHRIGNMVPSCKECNDKKGNKDFREFLEENNDKIEAILAYMRSKNYVPIGDNKQMKMILEFAYKEVATVAVRYIAIINSLFPDTSMNTETRG